MQQVSQQLLFSLEAFLNNKYKMTTLPNKNLACQETLDCGSLDETHSARTRVTLAYRVTVIEIKGLHECHLETE